MSELEQKSWLERVTDLFSGEPADRADLQEVLRAAADRQVIDGDVLNILFGALQVSEMRVRDIMIPRSQLVYLRADARPKDFLPLLIESRHSRFPVIGDDLDDVKGILHAKDILPLLLDEHLDDFDIKDCMRRATVVPESKRLNDLLQEFRSIRNHMAVVVDEYGNVAGAVTIEDVLEQIVGDIEDEHDVEDEDYVKRLDDGNFTVKAVMPIDEFNEYFDCEMPEDEFDTIGGIILRAFGHLPKRDEGVDVGDFYFRVLNADSRRIRLLHVSFRAAAGD